MNQNIQNQANNPLGPGNANAAPNPRPPHPPSATRLAYLPHRNLVTGNFAKYTRLWDSCLSGDAAVVEELLEDQSLDARKETIGRDGPESALINAVESRHLSTVKIVLRRMGREDFTLGRNTSQTLVKACAQDLEIAQALVAAGADPVRALNSRLETVLHVAARAASSATLEWLLSLPDVPGLINLKDVDGLRPLNVAWAAQNSAAIYVLLASGADPALPDRIGFYSLPIIYSNDSCEWVATARDSAGAAREARLQPEVLAAIDHWQSELRSTVQLAASPLIPDLVSIVLGYVDPNAHTLLSRPPARNWRPLLLLILETLHKLNATHDESIAAEAFGFDDDDE